MTLTPTEPLDLRIGATGSQHAEMPPLRWGIMGAGRVCHDFVQALKSVPSAGVVSAVGCRDINRSNEFADKHGIRGRYGSYKEVADDPEVEICYVAMLHPYHKDSALAAINAGKHVLVEKPMTCSVEDTRELVSAAKAKGVFIMEGMWTRFFPTVEKARELMESGQIGDVVAVHSDFGFNATDVAEYPDHQMYSHKLGGGGLLYVAPYPIAAAQLGFKGVQPSQTTAVGIKDDTTGVDMAASISTLYGSTGIGHITYNLMGETPEETLYIGTKGRIKILGPGHCPTSMEVHTKLPGRANVSAQAFEAPLPPLPQAVMDTGEFNYPNSTGFQYEAQAVHRCIRAGLTYCPQFTPEESIAVMEIMDATRVQLGVKPWR